MRVLVCGDRRWAHRDKPAHEARADIRRLYATLDGLLVEHGALTIIEGEAAGADRMGRTWARSHRQEVMPFPADWARYGRAAGPVRNQRMLDKGRPDLVVAFHDNLAGSKGTRDMVTRAEAAGVPVIRVGGEEKG